MRLHLAGAYHAADNLIIDAILRYAWMGHQVVADDRVYLLGESGLVFVAADRYCCQFIQFWLAEVDDQVALGYFVGGKLVVRLLAGINKESRLSSISDKADLGHDILHHRPRTLRAITIAERSPAPSFQRAI